MSTKKKEKKDDWHLPSIGKNEEPVPTEKDLKKLQEQCRVTGMMNTAFRKQTESLLLSQQKDINLLKEKQKELKLTILFTGSKKNIVTYQENTKKLYKLAEDQNKYNQLIHEKKNLICDLVIKIKEKEEELVNQKKEKSKAKILEQSKLDHLEKEILHVTQKYNMLKTENKNLRDSVEQLRLKKKEMIILIEKMQQKITDQKATIEKINEQIMSIHEEKTEIQTETLNIREIIEKLMEKFDVKIEGLSRYIDHLKTQQQFHEARSFDRSAMAKEHQQKREEKRLAEIKAHNQDVTDNYNKICEGLGRFFEQQNVDLAEMAERYSFNDMKNHSLFTYVNELNGEKANIEHEIKAAEDEMSNMEILNEKVWNEKICERKQLEEKLQKIKEVADQFQKKHSEMTGELQEITSALEDLVKKLNCDISSVKNKLGFDGLTCKEKLQYFDILEMRIDSLSQILSYRALKQLARESISCTSLTDMTSIQEMESKLEESFSKVHKKIVPSMKRNEITITNDTDILTYEQLREIVLQKDKKRTNRRLV